MARELSRQTLRISLSDKHTSFGGNSGILFLPLDWKHKMASILLRKTRCVLHLHFNPLNVNGWEWVWDWKHGIIHCGPLGLLWWRTYGEKNENSSR